MKVIIKNIDLYSELIPINAFIILSENSNSYIHHQKPKHLSAQDKELAQKCFKNPLSEI